MKCDSKKFETQKKWRVRPAFSLIEAMTAMTILAIIASSVLVVIDRCTVSASESLWRNRAFETARENMETLLAADTVTEKVEYGESEKYPQIQWQTTVEMFTEPTSSQMWAKAVCSAEYSDTAGEIQTIELTHWLTNITKEQLIELGKKKMQNLTAADIVETLEEAAYYAGVDTETIEEWVENGMLLTEDNSPIKEQLDLYKKTDGHPTAADKNQLLKTKTEDLLKEAKKQHEEAKIEKKKTDTYTDNVDGYKGYTWDELSKMSFEQLTEIFMKDRK